MKSIFSLATIPRRKTGLKRVINSLINQVDKGYLILNNFKNIPKFLYNYKNLIILKSQEIGDRESLNKFYPLKLLKEDVFYFSCDDDIIYSSNYINYMKNKIQNLNCIITQHGKKFSKFPITNYKTHISCRGLHFKNIKKKDINVPFGGTGVMGFNTNLFKPDISEFLSYQPVDAWIGITAKKQNIPIICVKTNQKLKSINYKHNIYNRTLGKNYISNKKLSNIINIVFDKKINKKEKINNKFKYSTR